AQQLLNENAPYWSTQESGPPIEVGATFTVYEISPTAKGERRYCIMSGETDDDLIILASQLEGPDFNLPRWVCRQLRGDTYKRHMKRRTCCHARAKATMGDAVVEGLAYVFNEAIPMPEVLRDSSAKRFRCLRRDDNEIAIDDTYLSYLTLVPECVLRMPRFDLVNAYSILACSTRLKQDEPPFSFDDLEGELAIWFPDDDYMICAEEMLSTTYSLELNANRVPAKTQDASNEDFIAALQRNAATPRDLKRLVPEPVVIVVHINGHPTRALLDSGSLADFMSAKLAHQLGIKTFELVKPLPVHLAVQGSHAKINMGCKASIRYQGISKDRYFDIVNLLNYDLILGTPFLFQHQITVGMNPMMVLVGSEKALPLEGKSIRVLASRAAELYEDKIEAARKLLREYAEPICRDASDAPLLPLRAVNHTIPLKDPNKVYSW
ncbi:hypothetical protein K474DRAFT_1726985, partial [Panus rudis PR-1116 ss-1]